MNLLLFFCAGMYLTLLNILQVSEGNFKEIWYHIQKWINNDFRKNTSVFPRHRTYYYHGGSYLHVIETQTARYMLHLYRCWKHAPIRTSARNTREIKARRVALLRKMAPPLAGRVYVTCSKPHITHDLIAINPPEQKAILISSVSKIWAGRFILLVSTFLADGVYCLQLGRVRMRYRSVTVGDDHDRRGAGRKW